MREKENMRKEILFAIFAGVFFGLVVAFGIWKANTSLKPGQAATDENASENTENTTQENTSLSGITIAKPLENQVIESNVVDLSGIATSSSYVVIQTENEDYVTIPEANGEFSQKIDLSPGINYIKATSFNKTSEKASVGMLLVYSSEFDKEDTDDKSPDEDEATNSAETIRQKVQKKVDNVIKNPIAFIGTITDISENTIQIGRYIPGDKEAGEIQLVSIKDETTYVDITNDSEIVEISDIAIGDFIAALGFKNGNEVLEAQRVLVQKKPGEIHLEPFIATVTNVNDKTVTVESANNTYSLSFIKIWKGPEISELSESMEIIVVGTVKENKIVDIRTLFVKNKTEE